MIGILMITGLVVLALLVGIRLTPIWIDYFTVVSVAESVQDARGEDLRSRARVKHLIEARFATNNLYEISPSAIKIKYDKRNNLLLHIQYEDRRHVLGNLDVVAVFDRVVGQDH